MKKEEKKSVLLRFFHKSFVGVHGRSKRMFELSHENKIGRKFNADVKKFLKF